MCLLLYGLYTQLMDELEALRKKKRRTRVRRNHDTVNLKIVGGTAGGCCSSWWGKRTPIIVQNTDSKYMNSIEGDDDYD